MNKTFTLKKEKKKCQKAILIVFKVIKKVGIDFLDNFSAMGSNPGPYLGFLVCGGKLHKPSQGSSVYRQGF